MKTLHLHACTRALGIDLVGLMDSPDGSAKDLILRSPGLRPRHWVTICASLQNGKAPENLDAFFPERFSPDGNIIEILGGVKPDPGLLNMVQPEKYAKSTALAVLMEDEDDGWDGLDEEELEAMKEVSSAVNIKSLDEVDIEEYPRLVIESFSDIPEGKRVDALLKILLPAVNVVNKKQEEDKERAMSAMQLRDRREAIKKAQKDAKKKALSRDDYFNWS